MIKEMNEKERGDKRKKGRGEDNGFTKE